MTLKSSPFTGFHKNLHTYSFWWVEKISQLRWRLLRGGPAIFLSCTFPWLSVFLSSRIYSTCSYECSHLLNKTASSSSQVLSLLILTPRISISDLFPPRKIQPARQKILVPIVNHTFSLMHGTFTPYLHFLSANFLGFYTELLNNVSDGCHTYSSSSAFEFAAFFNPSK